jgi:nitric oxide reductase NorE protein
MSALGELVHVDLTNPALARRSAHRRLAGEPGVWVFIGADMAAFGLFFLIFTYGRAAHPALYEQSRQALNPTIGLLSTLFLITSGWLVALAVGAARSGDRGPARILLVLAMLVGSGFAVNKIIEYSAKISSGITMLTNEFFTYYFIFTGIHFIHFLIGMVALAACVSKARSEPSQARFLTWIESVVCYWHMVDLLWIVLFPMLYLQL